MREKWIDTAKGIAILLVILAHVDENWSFAFGFHLVVFFIVSGYTLKKINLTKDFLKKKFSRLMVPYFYTCFAVTITDIINSLFINNQRSIAEITGVIGKDAIRCFFASGSITTFGTIEVGSRIGAIWFLPALFFGLTITSILVGIVFTDVKLLLVSLAIALSAFISARFIWLPFSIQSGLFATPFLCIGHIIKKRELLQRLKPVHYVVAFLILVIGIKAGVCYIGFVSASSTDLIFSTIVGLSGAITVYLISNVYNGHFLGIVGKLSLGIMCVHLYALETMGAYFNAVLNLIGVSGLARVVCSDLIHILFAIIGAILIEQIKGIINKRKKQCNKALRDSSRNESVDIAKGILIITMLIGHYAIDNTLRAIIFSCHMIAFVLLSGYFYNPNRSFSISLKRAAKGLLKPYCIAAVIALLISYKVWEGDFIKDTIVKYCMGMSFSKNLFIHAGSVGPIYFILLLFLTRLVYLCIDHFLPSEFYKWTAVFAVSVFGVFCGVKGWWLPWSFDVACYTVVFYKMGVFFKSHEILDTVRQNNYMYFALSPIWAYMIYSGSMELAIRQYGHYGLTVIGSIAGVITVYMFSCYINDNMRYVGRVLSLCGRSSIFILIVHTFRGPIMKIAALRFDPNYLPYMVVTIVIQLVISVTAYLIIEYFKQHNKKYRMVIS